MLIVVCKKYIFLNKLQLLSITFKYSAVIPPEYCSPQNLAIPHIGRYRLIFDS